MVDGLHILMWNRTKKPFAITLSRVGKGVKGREGGGDLNNVQYKTIWNCPNGSPLSNKYTLIQILIEKV
jgi:hypothetical protein